MKSSWFAALALVSTAWMQDPAPAVGDLVCLKDGRIVDGRPMERASGGITVHYKNGDVFIPDALIEDAVLAADLTAPPANAEEAEQKKNGFVRFEGKWVAEKRRNEMLVKRIQDRQHAIEEMKAHAEWRNRYIEETKNFRFEYTIPPHVFDDYRDALEAFFKEFSKVWKLETPKGNPKLPVNIFADARTFHQVGGVPDGVLAYFRFVKPWDLDGFHERLDPEYSKQVFFHEFTHYLEKLVDLDFAYPHFPNESVAEYYGASHWDPATKKFTTGLLQEGRLCEIETDIASGQMMSLDTLLTTARMYQHYTWGWSLVHFLMSDAKYRPKFQSFFMALSKGKGIQRDMVGADNLQTCEPKEVMRVFMQEMGLKDATALRKLEAEWHDDVQKKIKLTTISGKEKAGLKAKEDGRVIRAKRFFKEAIDGGSKNPLVLHHYADLLFADSQWDEGFAMLKRALELDPLNGWFWGTLGRAKRAMGQKEEAARLIALAKEVGYDDPFIELQIENEQDDPKKKGGPGDKGGD